MVSWGINPVFTGLSPTHGQVTYALLTRAPLATRGAAARLACVRPVASVHPEPGSNSPLYELFFLYALGHPYVELTYLLAMLSCLTFSSIAISSKISLYSFPVPSVGCLRFRKRVQK